MSEVAQNTGVAEGTPAKKKKVNKLTLTELKGQIFAIEEKKLNNSRYYAHLVERQKELEAQV